MIRSILLIVLLLPAIAPAAGIPLAEDSRWYVHANFEAMRGASDGRALYDWVEREVLEDVIEEFGRDFVDRFEAVTVFGGRRGHEQVGVVLDGRLAAEQRQALLERFAAEQLDGLGDGSAFELGASAELGDDIDIDIDGSLYLGLGDGERMLITPSMALLERFVAGDARLEPASESQLIIVRADSLLGGAVDAESLEDDSNGWNSNVMRNIRQAAFSLADADGHYELRVDLVAVDVAQAQALVNIVEGLVSLRALSEEEPDMAFLSGLESRIEGHNVTLSLRLPPEELVRVLD
jgi:hypothetical protein